MKHHNTDFRTLSDVRLHRELGDMLAARRAKQEAARELRIRKLPTPIQPEPANFCAEPDADETNDARWELVLALIFAALLTPLVAAFAGWFLPIAWGMK